MGRRAAGGPPQLTRLEEEVMRAIWDAQPGPVCVRDVLDSINASRDKPLAYNTVQTVFTLLREKQAIKLANQQGRAHYFVPTYSRAQAAGRTLTELARRMFGGRLKPLLHQMIDDPQLSAEDLQELRAWVDEKLRDEKLRERAPAAKKPTRRGSTRKRP